MSAIWNGERLVSGEADLKRECLHCGYCGARMREVLHPSPTFDRKTGAHGNVGSMYWQCPKRGVGLDALLGDWVRAGYESNPHDSAFLREVKA